MLAELPSTTGDEECCAVTNDAWVLAELSSITRDEESCGAVTSDGWVLADLLSTAEDEEGCIATDDSGVVGTVGRGSAGVDRACSVVLDNIPDQAK